MLVITWKDGAAAANQAEINNTAGQCRRFRPMVDFSTPPSVFTSRECFGYIAGMKLTCLYIGVTTSSADRHGFAALVLGWLA